MQINLVGTSGDFRDFLMRKRLVSGVLGFVSVYLNGSVVASGVEMEKGNGWWSGNGEESQRKLQRELLSA